MKKLKKIQFTGEGYSKENAWRFVCKEFPFIVRDLNKAIDRINKLSLKKEKKKNEKA